MATGGIVPWSIINVYIGNTPDEGVNYGAQQNFEFDAATSDPEFMRAAGFSGPVYETDPDTLNRVLNRDVWSQIQSRFGSGQLRFALARLGFDDYYAFVGPNNELVGKVLPWYTGDDTAFWRAAMLAKSVITAGVADAAQVAQNAAQAAQSSTPSLLGQNMDFDFDAMGFTDYDYGGVFDSFNFTSGEGFSLFSDAQSVDFGFGSGWGDFGTGINWGNLPEDIGFNFETSFDWGSTFESGVSDFGTWFSNTALDPVKDELVKYGTNKVISTFIKPPPPAPPRAQTPITTKSIANGVQDLAGAAMQLIGVRNAYSSTANQRETSQPQQFRGQLAPGGQRIANENPGMNPWVLGGLALAAAGAIWYVSKKG